MHNINHTLLTNQQSLITDSSNARWLNRLANPSSPRTLLGLQELKISTARFNFMVNIASQIKGECWAYVWRREETKRRKIQVDLRARHKLNRVLQSTAIGVSRSLEAREESIRDKASFMIEPYRGNSLRDWLGI